VAVTLPGSPASGSTSRGSGSGSKGAAEFLWNPRGHAGCAIVDAPRSKAVIGKFPPGQRFSLGDVQIEAGDTRQGWAAVLLTAIDGPNFRSPGRLLVTAAAYTENTAMGWIDAHKSTVGSDWGRAPSLVEGVAAIVSLPATAQRVRAWSLDERGQRKAPVEIQPDGKRAKLAIGPAHETLWYEVEIKSGTDEK
jgi:hypothetical protein